MTAYIIDCEANGLLSVGDKIHCLCYQAIEGGAVSTITDYQEMRKFLFEAKTLVAHNLICYDIPMLEKVLGIKIEARLIDTLALSWYLNHSRVIHGLDSYGKDYGIPKPKITDWSEQPPEVYAHRCIEDVKINSALWKDLKKKLLRIYGTKKEADRLIRYLSFKMDCLREQEQSKWKLDKALAEQSLQTLLGQQDEKLPQLVEAMPEVVKTASKTKPAKCYKKDGSLSVAGVKWFKLLKDMGLPDNYAGEVEVEVGREPANPNSHDQIKQWLFSLGWEPMTYKYVRDKDTGVERTIPQVRVDGDEGKELCPSVLELIKENPAVGVLDGLTTIQHRISIFKGFLDNQEDGWLIAGAAGLTNTLRFKHRVLVNLPGVGKGWGEEIRGCLVAPEGYVLCGSDMTSLEDTTKKHYMYPYDPDFVNEMSSEGFDPHLDLAKFAGVVTQQEIDDYVGKVEGAKNLKTIRSGYKVTNYSATYGVKPPKLSRTTGLPVKEAAKLLDSFWERNWSLLKIAEDATIQHVGQEMWLYNPVSKFWYSLRYKKDIFSTLNQGSGVYCFYTWIRIFRSKRPQLTGQFHDEVILCIKEGYEDKCTELLTSSIKEANEFLKLNVTLGVDIQYGKRYSDIH